MAGSDPPVVAIRVATAADEANLLAWRNHPSVRAVSRNSQAIAEDAHRLWLRTTLADPRRCLLIGEVAGTAAGVVRFDLLDESAEVSIHLVPEAHGLGLGAPLLAAAEAWLRARRPEIATLEAEVLGDNRSSHRLFSSSGYAHTAGRYRKSLLPLP